MKLLNFHPSLLKVPRDTTREISRIRCTLISGTQFQEHTSHIKFQDKVQVPLKSLSLNKIISVTSDTKENKMNFELKLYVLQKLCEHLLNSPQLFCPFQKTL